MLAQSTTIGADRPVGAHCPSAPRLCHETYAPSGLEAYHRAAARDGDPETGPLAQAQYPITLLTAVVAVFAGRRPPA